MDKLYSYKVEHIQLKTKKDNGPQNVEVKVHISLAEPAQATDGDQIHLTLRMPCNETDSLSSIRNNVYLRVLTLLDNAKKLCEGHLSEDGDDFYCKSGAQ